jgi:thioredoxin 2
MNLICPACGTTNRVPDDRLSDQPICGRCKGALMAAQPVDLDDDRLPGFIAGTELPVVVDFWADWCAPCKLMAPHFATVAAQLPQVRFVKVDTEANPEASARSQIRSIPTLILYQGGRETARQSGALTAGDLLRWVQAQLARPN